jgi:hypothetical protein
MPAAASKNYQVKSVSFTPTGGSIQTKTDEVVNVEHSVNGEVVDWSGGGAVAVQGHNVENIKGSVVVTLLDQSMVSDASWKVGVAGVLVTTYQQRKDGSGAVSGGDKTVTGTSSVVTNVSQGLPHRGQGTIQISFEVVDASGVYPFSFG